MLVFVSAGEPSGDLHGANLVRALKACSPDIECVGFGGERMASAGTLLYYPLCDLAVMGFVRVLTHLREFFRVLDLAEQKLRERRPDALVLIDFPGFHWLLASRARKLGIPVIYFVPPQLWGWGGWRVRKMRRLISHVFCNLPFEQAWYQQRGIEAHYVGHPYFDELAARRLDEQFLATQSRGSGRIVALLPGSREQEVEHNFPMQLRAARRIHESVGDVRFLVAAFKESHREKIEAQVRESGIPVEVLVGRTPEIIHLAHACIAVSGSVSLELLFHGKPSVMVYRMSRSMLWLCKALVKVPYMTLVNLMAGEELFPEFPTAICRAQEISEHVIRWLSEDGAKKSLSARLEKLRSEVAVPGACSAAAEWIVELAGGTSATRPGRAA